MRWLINDLGKALPWCIDLMKSEVRELPHQTKRLGTHDKKLCEQAGRPLGSDVF